MLELTFFTSSSLFRCWSICRRISFSSK